MKLRKTELCVMVVTLVFLAFSAGWLLGKRHAVPTFRVETAASAEIRETPFDPDIPERRLPEADPESPAPAETGVPVSEEGAEYLTGRVNINTADVEELKTLDGIGDVLANRIVEYRKKNGPFTRALDLMEVDGISLELMERNQDRLTVLTGEDFK